MDNALFREHLAHESVLDIDPPGVAAGEVTDELLVARGRGERVLGQDVQEALRLWHAQELTAAASTSTFYPGLMLELSQLDLDEIATALSDQTDYDHRWLIDPTSGQVSFWTSDTGLDGENPVDLEDVDLTLIDPLPSYVWYQDMADFADRLSDDPAGRRLARAIAGKGAFRRFKNALHEEFPDLLPTWHAFRETRANRRAVDWLADEGLIPEDDAGQYRQNHPDPEVP